MTKPTLGKKLPVLIELGLLIEIKRGREKNLRITEKGKQLIGQ
jgi:predicted transcriptional regulator